MNNKRVLSGMRPTGKLHLGHFHGVLANWKQLQNQHQCMYFIADWHALTTHYENRASLADSTLNVLVDWLISGIEPEKATLFQQSQLPQHAELHLALSMITPLGWLERVPTYKDQIEKLKQLDLSTYGFLGYPVLQAADILVYRAELVPVGADQVAHIEMCREIARRFNYIFGRDSQFDAQLEQALASLDASQRKNIKRAHKQLNEKGEKHHVERAIEVLKQTSLSQQQQDIVAAWMENRGLTLLPEPEALIMPKASKVPGLDGQKMSKSYGNSIYIRDDSDRIVKQVRQMPTDPARVRKTDPGNPDVCPVWDLHKIYTLDPEQQRLDQGCRSGNIGCLDCKGVLYQKLVEDNEVFNQRAQPYLQDKAQLTAILKRGNEQAGDLASATINMVKQSIGFFNERI